MITIPHGIAIVLLSGMKSSTSSHIQKEFHNYLTGKSFPCIGAKASVGKDQSYSFTAGSIQSPNADAEILEFIYSFIDDYRNIPGDFYSAAILFADTDKMCEHAYEHFMWQRLQAISNLDAERYPYDDRVSSNTGDSSFSFSLKQESFFIIGLHPGSSRPARQFQYPALVFNPHQQFEKMRESTKYESMQKVVRKKDILLAGSINPMLSNHGKDSEVWQYSGRNYSNKQVCPLKINHSNG